MIEPLPRWARAFVIAVVVVGVAFAVVRWLDDGLGAAQPASWRVDPTVELTPGTRVVPVIVTERGCSSGRSAEGRIRAMVVYRPDTVTIDIGVRPYGGNQDCPSHPATDYDVHLDEPLGDRRIVGEQPSRRSGPTS